MATQIVPQPIVGPYPTLPVTAASLDLAFVAADVTGNFFTADQISVTVGAGSIGGDILLVWNTDAAPHNLTISSQPLNGRTGDITSYVVGAGVISAFKFSQLAGWQSGSTVTFTADNALVKLAVLTR
jgi:hypothetical protein